MPFQKGTSGNPGGRKRKRQDTAEILRAIGDLAYPGQQLTYRERAAQVLWEQAAKGNLQALAWITDRAEGKVPDKKDVTVTGTVQLVPWGPKAAAEGASEEEETDA